MSKHQKRLQKLCENPKSDDYLALRYRIVLTPEEDGWRSINPDLPGCIGVGDTLEETVMMIEDARRSWIEASFQRGLLIPEPTNG